MPPRIPAPSGLLNMTLCRRPRPTLHTPPSLTPLVHSAPLTENIRRKKDPKPTGAATDPYREALRAERRNRNLALQASLTTSRTEAHGDPVQGIPTPYLESFDSAGQLATTPVRTDGAGRVLEAARDLPTSPDLLNFRLTRAEMDDAISQSYELTKPPAEHEAKGPIAQLDPTFRGMELAGHEAQHVRVVEALRRITTLENGSSRDRRFANIRRIVDEFGRHVTDSKVPQKGLAHGQTERVEKIRGGPDTGSSEVQIAILTAKIRVLAKMYAGPKGNKDKHNKRNLRLLCHRRQKLLQYMMKKERGSGRWEHMIKTLGLTPATWEGQIEIR